LDFWRVVFPKANLAVYSLSHKLINKSAQSEYVRTRKATQSYANFFILFVKIRRYAERNKALRAQSNARKALRCFGEDIGVNNL